MKKRKMFILFTVLSLIFVGCSNLIESTVKIDELDTVSGVSMGEVNLEDEKLAFTLINDTYETIYYGEDILLEKNKNGKWYKVSLSGDVGILAILNYLPPHSEDMFTYPLEIWKGVSSGTYRFIKEFYLEDTLKEPKYIFKEFEL